ncbi:MAG: hypothetical protein ACOVKO_07035 [Elstera sp.]
MYRTSLPVVAVLAVIGLSSAVLAQQAVPTIGGTGGGTGDAGARERAAASAIEQQVEYRNSLQRDLAQREQLLRTSEKELETRKARLKATHLQLLTTAQKVQVQAAKLRAAAETPPPAPEADPNGEATAADVPPEEEAEAIDPSVVKRLSRDLEVQSYEIQVASAQINRLQQEVDYLRGVIAQMSGARR